MSTSVLEQSGHRGLRMTADEFLALGETPERYELIDGVVCTSPSASFAHQRITTEIAIQIGAFLKSHPLGMVAAEVDVRFGPDLVYRPDVIYLTNEKAARCGTHVTEAPDVVVEVISPDSARLDRETKRRDYERHGVGEYWLIDPLGKSMTFFGRAAGGFFERVPGGEQYECQVVPRFKLDLRVLREMMERP